MIVEMVEMENYKSVVKRVKHLKAIDTITPCYFVILHLSWNSVTSFVWCHFWFLILTKKKNSCFWVNEILNKTRKLISELQSYLFIDSLEWLWFLWKKFLRSDFLYNYKYSCKHSSKYFKEIWSYCIYIKLGSFWIFTILPMFFEQSI